MDFDDVKENIQPLAQGRNASILHASLKVESSQDLLVRRRELEREIHIYSGDDPLSVWYNYIEWIEQSFPSGGKESGLQEVLCKCLARFESDERYKQDRRMVKLYIKFIDSHKDPAECYQQLFCAGIGTMVADFYIAWAYCYDMIGNTRKADEIFLQGIACRAQPLEELQEARQHFGFSVAQRLMYKDDDTIREETNRQLLERRMALTTLKGHYRKQIVGSIRTGSAVKNVSPGTVKVDLPSTSQRGNSRVQIFKDESKNTVIIETPSIGSTLEAEIGKSVVRSIIDAARNQENQKEPGPWNRAHNRKKGKLFGKSVIINELGFEIHEDENSDFEDIKKPCVPPIPVADNEIKFDKPFIYPPNFCAKSKPLKGWLTPVTTEEMPEKNTIPDYNKCKLYPRPNIEFQPEELKAYNVLKARGIKNEFTKERDIYWGCGPNYNIRFYPHFALQSKPQKIDLMDQPYIPEKIPGLKVAFDEIYNSEDKIERQFEEILALRIKRNETITKVTDMEETMCVTSEKIQRRKSFFPMRKSLAASTFNTLNSIANIAEQNAKDEKLATHKFCSSSISSSDENVLETLKVKPSLLNVTNSKNDSPQILGIEATCSKTIPIVPELTFKEAKSPKLLIQKQCEDRMQFNESEQIASDAVLLKHFETQSNLSAETKFQFKTPALPIANSIAVTNNLPFEIFDDENLAQRSLNTEPKPDLSCGTGVFFDPEETCSTQTFNIDLKAQSVSTPKAITKLQPERQFGNILKDITPPSIPEQKDDYHLTSSVDNQKYTAGVAAVAAYSPPRQQLSTILETSEHGTTQGTHTTGATTKSTISSPEVDKDFQVQTTTNPVANQPQTVLETVKELSCETSIAVDELMNSLKIHNVIDTNKNIHAIEKNIETPGALKLRNKGTSHGIDFSIFEDSLKDQKQVGNFSRLEEKENTVNGSVFKSLAPIRFQDDKTETISKMLITSQQVKLHDDKTETISRNMFEPLVPPQFQEKKTETISNMLLDLPQPIKFPEDKSETIFKFLLVPPQPIEFPEDKTETMSKILLGTPFKYSDNKSETLSKFMLTPHESTKKKDEKCESIVLNKENCQHKDMYQDDSFDFFGQTPPKPKKHMVTKQIELVKPVSAIDNKDTLGIYKTKSVSRPKVLFEDEVQPHVKNNNFTYLQDFSFFEENQPGRSQNIAKPKSKSVFRDSFIPDFSIIEDSQPQTKREQLESQHKMINESNLPEFSLIKNTQPSTSSKSVQPNTRNISSDFLHVSETQSNESVLRSSQPTESRYLKKSMQPSVETTFLKSGVEENEVGDNTKWQQPSNCSIVSNRKEDSATLKNILMDTFIRDFSEINKPSRTPADIKEITHLQSIKNKSSLIFLNESLNTKCENPKAIQQNNAKIANICSNKETRLSFLTPKSQTEKSSNKEKNSIAGSNDDKYFEPNCATEMFGTNMSMIKNSTWLPNHEPSAFGNAKQLSQIKEKSLHIKTEEVSSKSLTSSWTEKSKTSTEDSTKSNKKIVENSLESNKENDYCEMSIYYKNTPKTPRPQVHIWDDDDAYKSSDQNNYIHSEPDLNQTHQVIENMCIDPNVNPFNVDLINAFLEQHYVISYLESLPTCKLVGCIQRLRQNATININGTIFDVVKLIGEGAYGAVFCGKEMSTGKLVAMKQEKPPNFWEYYICLEIQERIRTDEMLHAYMSVDYALIGNNSSILISNFSKYGSLITVCNKIKKHTLKNVDEYVVMLLASEILEIIDHLHAVNIIHADVKADNFLLLNKLTYPSTVRHLQLIDFGVSIDMKLFKPNQTFSFVHSDNSFKCPEMRERRPWTYQLDLYGLAGVLHVLLFGKYMDIERNARGFWMHKTHIPRYINKKLWDEIFKTLLNIRDCKSMPNLQHLRALLKKEMEEKDKYVIKMVNDFNRALSN